jgi:dCMP deaminase
MKMKKQKEMDETNLKMAKTWAELSYCTRKKVGALIVKNGMIISDGFNGTISKSKPNVCENIDGETHWWVLHGEANAILKCAKHGQSCDEATLYQTHSPCKDCSKLILQAGIKRVVYIEDYKDLAGIDLLLESGIIVDKMII